jgi:hypothetical protein
MHVALPTGILSKYSHGQKVPWEQIHGRVVPTPPTQPPKPQRPPLPYHWPPGWPTQPDPCPGLPPPACHTIDGVFFHCILPRRSARLFSIQPSYWIFVKCSDSDSFHEPRVTTAICINSLHCCSMASLTPRQNMCCGQNGKKLPYDKARVLWRKAWMVRYSTLSSKSLVSLISLLPSLFIINVFTNVVVIHQ